MRRPTKSEVQAAAGKTVPDVIAPGLDVLFCGINPGLYSGATGFHFARPGNRFWPTLHGAGFTDRRLDPSEEQLLLDAGCGITNLVTRATATAAELENDELAGAQQGMSNQAGVAKPKSLVGVRPWVDIVRAELNQGEQRLLVLGLFCLVWDFDLG